jgi:hypothetical protein
VVSSARNFSTGRIALYVIDVHMSDIHRIVLLGSLAAFATLPVRAQGNVDLDDTAARIQYAFYTADARSLEELLNTLGGGGGAETEAPSAIREYYLAYGHWRLAETYADQAAQNKRSDARGLASRAARDCAEHAEAAYKQDARLAEAYALEAICSSPPGRAASPGARRPSGSCAKSRVLRTGLEIEPANPRIRLIEVICSGSDKAGDSVILARLRGVVNAFDNAPVSRPGKPDWGHAEALVLLGQSYIEHGESVPARDALERALVLAPDYKAAQELLRTSPRAR